MRMVPIALALTVLLAAGSATGQVAGDKEWAAFRQGSYAQFAGDDSQDWESLLYRAAASDRSREQAIVDFAAAIGVPQDRARAYADAIIATVAMSELCYEEPTGCDAAHQARVRQAAAAVALQDPTGALLTVIARNLVSQHAGGSPDGVLEMALSHPAKTRVLAAIYQYTGEAGYLAASVAITPADPATAYPLQWAAADRSGDGDGDASWLLAATAWAWEEGLADAAVSTRLIYSQALITQLLKARMGDRAVAVWDGLPSDERAALPVLPVGVPREDKHATALRSAGQFVDELAVALWTRGRTEDAETLLARGDATLGDRSRDNRHQAVLDAMASARAEADLFDLYTMGLPDKTRDSRRGPFVEGAWKDLPYWPESRKLVGQRLRAAHYDSFADYIDAAAPAPRTEPSLVAASADQLPAGVAAHHAAILAEAPWLEPVAPNAERPGFAPRTTAQTAWVESQRRSESGAAHIAARRPSAQDLPDWLDPDAVALFQDLGGERIVVYRSSTYDLPGEIPAFGLWLVRWREGAWEKPVYLGLQEHFPYVVSNVSDRPVIDGDDIRLPVEAREIDPGSITFPPVGLRFSREENDLLITAALDDITRDSDSDGLTDLVENRLGLAPADPDMDRDGLVDGRDPLPQVSAAQSSGAVPGLAQAILKTVAGYDARAIMVAPGIGRTEPLDLLSAFSSRPDLPPSETVILVADPAIFAGLSLPFQLLVYTPEQAQALERGGAPFYPIVVKTLSSPDRRRHFVIWSASWVGGTFSATCEADGSTCAVEDLGSWIT